MARSQGIRALEVLPGPTHSIEQTPHATSKAWVRFGQALEKRRAFRAILDGEGFGEEVLFPLEIFTHERLPAFTSQWRSLRPKTDRESRQPLRRRSMSSQSQALANCQ